MNGYNKCTLVPQCKQNRTEFDKYCDSVSYISATNLSKNDFAKSIHLSINCIKRTPKETHDATLL